MWYRIIGSMLVIAAIAGGYLYANDSGGHSSPTAPQDTGLHL